MFVPPKWYPRRSSYRVTGLLVGCWLFVLPGLTPGGDGAPDVFRICVLVKDMPLSHRGPDEYSQRLGLYIDLAEAMASAAGKELEVFYAIVAFYKRPVQSSLLENRCDAYFGLPREESDWFIPRRVRLTKAFMSIGYGVVVPRSETIQTLEDLRGKTVGVQPGSPPAISLAQLDGVETRIFLDPEPALEALDRGEIDAAFVWGPRAGYYNKYVYEGAYRVLPTALRWPVAIGVRASRR